MTHTIEGFVAPNSRVPLLLQVPGLLALLARTTTHRDALQRLQELGTLRTANYTFARHRSVAL